MRLLLSSIGSRSRNDRLDAALGFYLERIGGYEPTEPVIYRSPEALFDALDRQRERTRPFLIMLDSRGKQLASEQFAERIGKLRDEGQQTIVFAVGPADGWSDEARKRADLLLSLGPMTLPHELARVVLSEQIYRAFTILSGHPYHTGH